MSESPEASAIIDQTIDASRRKREAFDELGRLRRQYEEQTRECMRLRDAEQELIDKVIAMGLAAEWSRRVERNRDG